MVMVSVWLEVRAKVDGMDGMGWDGMDGVSKVSFNFLYTLCVYISYI